MPPVVAEPAPVAKRGRKPKAATLENAAVEVSDAPPARATRSRSKAAPKDPEPAEPVVVAVDPVVTAVEPQAVTEPENPAPKPRKKGWWNLGG